MGNAAGELYAVGKKRWYCRDCGKRTAIEINPEWITDGRPHVWDHRVKDYEWVARCSCCQSGFSDSGYDCPNCGFDNIVEQEPLKIENYHENSYYSYEFGSVGYDWEEQHQCPVCRSKFWFSNSTH